jgi:antitoxin VapB
VPVALSIKSAKADQLARDLASLTGESITDAVVLSLQARLESERRRRRDRSLDDIVDRFGTLPLLDDRDPDDIVGYDEHGLPS